MFVDIGLNLSSDRFDADREAVLQRGLAAGVSHLILTGTNLEESRHPARLPRDRGHASP